MRMLISFSFLLAAMCAGYAAAAVVEHVVVIGVDALGPIGIEKAETPHLDALIAKGAHTFEARSVMPTSSSPCWASMIMGAGPEQHGILSNDWPLPKGFLKPTATGHKSMFPTMFYVLRQARPDIVTAVVYDWGGFARLYERDLVDVNIDGDGAEDTAVQAAAVIRERKPALTFVHLDHVDHALHQDGFASEPYFREVEKADALIGKILAAVEAAGIAATTAVIVAADHGGDGKSHGGTSLAEMTIPWIIAGPGVAAGKTIDMPVNIYDTAVTVVHLLGVEPHPAWIGRPVVKAGE
jgi:predicted AlkP superfamily pyrophosphatase or phosphodiesterase